MLKLLSSKLNKLLSIPTPQPQIIQQISKHINRSLISAYQSQQMDRYLSSIPVIKLLHKSVEYYVGSRITPRNQPIMRILLERAQKNSQNQSQEIKNEIKYFYAYFVKLSALQSSDEKQYDRSSNMFMKIAEKGHQLSNYLVGKQIYKMVESGEMGNWNDEEIMGKCKDMFVNSLGSQQFGGLYYLADLQQKRGLTQQPRSRRGQTKEEMDDRSRMLMEMFTQSASLGYPLAYFKLALKYKQQQNYKLYKKYLLMASESGVIQAQHNLALEYLSGEHFPKNQIKSIAWFIQASAHGFIYSKYNLSKIFKQGTSCGTLKPNKKASLIYLEEIHRSGEIDVTKEIEELSLEIEGVPKQAQK